MVEQWDTEQIGMLRPPDVQDVDTNNRCVTHVPPVLTKTWFHTGTHVGWRRSCVGPVPPSSTYREPALSDDEAHALLLADTVLPAGLTLEEQTSGVSRALKGVMAAAGSLCS
jgi:hypothetical protein